MLQDNILRYKDNQQNYGYSYNPFSAVLHHTLQLGTRLSQKSGKTYEEPICFKLQVVLNHHQCKIPSDPSSSSLKYTLHGYFAILKSLVKKKKKAFSQLIF